tara:strand:- start:158 stop:1687 length:1530 start_codon:yes stop_codon:yes gene_type:complete
MKKPFFSNVKYFSSVFYIALSVISPSTVNASDVTFLFEVAEKNKAHTGEPDKKTLSQASGQSGKNNNNQKEPLLAKLPYANEKPFVLQQTNNIKTDQERGNNYEIIELNPKTTKFEKLLMLIESAPELSSALADIRISEGNIARLQANTKPVFSLSTSGNFPITSSLEPGDRGYRTDKRFIDVTGNLRQTVFDFGKNAHLVRSEEKTKKAKEVTYEIKRRILLFEALQFGIDISTSEQLLAEIDIVIDANTKRLDTEKKRYLSGSGTVASVKDISLLQVENLNKKQLEEYSLKNAKQLFKTQFGEEIDIYLEEMSEYFAQLPAQITQDFFPLELEEIKKLEIELEAIQEEILAVEKSNHPNLSLSVTANSYDIFSESLSEYEILGGLTVSKPILDGGLSKSEKSILLSQRKIALARKDQKVRALNEDWENNKSEYSDTKQKIDNLNFQIYELSEKLQFLDMLAKGTTSKGTELAEIENRIFSLKREKTTLDWQLKKIIIRSLLLSEVLI